MPAEGTTEAKEMPILPHLLHDLDALAIFKADIFTV